MIRSLVDPHECRFSKWLAEHTRVSCHCTPRATESRQVAQQLGVFRWPHFKAVQCARVAVLLSAAGLLAPLAASTRLPTSPLGRRASAMPVRWCPVSPAVATYKHQLACCARLARVLVTACRHS